MWPGEQQAERGEVPPRTARQAVTLAIGLKAPRAVQRCQPQAPWGGGNLFAVRATDAAGKLHVLHEDRDSLGMDGAEVTVLKKSYEVRLRRFLQSQHRGCLPAVRAGCERELHLAHLPLPNAHRGRAQRGNGLANGGNAGYPPPAHRPFRPRANAHIPGGRKADAE